MVFYMFLSTLFYVAISHKFEHSVIITANLKVLF